MSCMNFLLFTILKNCNKFFRPTLQTADCRISIYLISGVVKKFDSKHIITVFQNSLQILKIYSIRNVNYRFSVLAVYFETYPKCNHSIM